MSKMGGEHPKITRPKWFNLEYWKVENRVKNEKQTLICFVN